MSISRHSNKSNRSIIH